jgi:general secretion pathway protein I
MAARRTTQPLRPVEPQRPAAPLRTGARGFTLLEVMVAVAILGLGLTAILSAQFGAVKGATHARYISQATGLARCKMAEVEEQLAIDGYQELDQTDSGECCVDQQAPEFSCEWSIQKPMFPEPDLGKLDLDSNMEGLGAIAELAQGAQSDKGKSDPTSALGDADLTSLAAGGMGGIASMVMGMVYPDLKNNFEASTRRITVSVLWREGSTQNDLTIVQWVARPQQGGVDVAGFDEMQPGGAGPGATPPPPPRRGR